METTWKHSLNWFEIPALDIERAFAFYSAILPEGAVRMGTFGNGPLVLFNVPFGTGEAVGGSIVVRPDLQPTTSGPTIFLNTYNTLAECVERVAANGGKVLVPHMDLGKFGSAAIILDSEGNKIGLHQNNL